jgi:hypothetical protein
VQQCNILASSGYALKLETRNDPSTVIDVTDNFWGVADSTLIEGLIYHHADNEYCPVADFVPFADSAFTIEDTVATPIWEPDELVLPDHFLLLQNYPNPFNSGTMIKFTVPRTTNVILTIHDVLGRQVRTLWSRQTGPGTYQVEFDGNDCKGLPLASGVYIYQLRCAGHSYSRKMVLLR